MAVGQPAHNSMSSTSTMWPHVISCDLVYHVILCDFMWSCVPCDIMWSHVILCTMWYHVISCNTMWCCLISYDLVIPCDDVWYHMVSCDISYIIVWGHSQASRPTCAHTCKSMSMVGTNKWLACCSVKSNLISKTFMSLAFITFSDESCKTDQLFKLNLNPCEVPHRNVITRTHQLRWEVIISW